MDETAVERLERELRVVMSGHPVDYGFRQLVSRRSSEYGTSSVDYRPSAGGAEANFWDADETMFSLR